MSHTPGPWYVTDDQPPDAVAHDAHGATIVARFDYLTVYSKDSTRAHTKDDVALFMASPGLLKACKSVVALYNRLDNEDDSDWRLILGALGEVADEAQVAIAKTEVKK